MTSAPSQGNSLHKENVSTQSNGQRRLCANFLLVAVGLRRGVFHDVRTLVLEFVAQAEALCELERQEDRGAQPANPEDDDEPAQNLDPELVAAVEQTVAADAPVLFAEEPDGEDTPEATGPVHREGVDDVVDLELGHGHRGSLVDEGPDDANDDRLPGLHEAAAGSD